MPFCVLHWAERDPLAPAIVEQDQTHGYGDVAVGIVQWARALAARAVGPGMLVGLQHERRYLHFLLIQACQLLGATSVSLSAPDIAANDPLMSRCDFLCVRQPPAHHSDNVLVLSPPVIADIATQSIARSDLRMLDRDPAPGDVLRLVKTSGSTGHPKIMAMTAESMRRLVGTTLRLPDDPDYDWNFVNLYDFTLRSALRETEIALMRGRTAVSSTLPTFWTDVRRFDSCRCTLVTGDATRLAASIPADRAGPWKVMLTVKGGALPVPVRSALAARVATHVYHTYAANEVHCVSFVDADGVGRVRPGVTVRIVDDDGAVLPVGATGLIEVSPPLVDRYLWDDDATRQAFRDGWYRTLDVGYQPDPDRLVVLGRSDDVLNVGGVKIVPTPFEDQLRLLPGIEEAVVIVVPGASGRDTLAVAVEAPDGSLPIGLADAIAAILVNIDAPITVFPIPALPRTEHGKIRRTAIRAIIETRTGRSGEGPAVPSSG